METRSKSQWIRTCFIPLLGTEPMYAKFCSSSLVKMNFLKSWWGSGGQNPVLSQKCRKGPTTRLASKTTLTLSVCSPLMSKISTALTNTLIHITVIYKCLHTPFMSGGIGFQDISHDRTGSTQFPQSLYRSIYHLIPKRIRTFVVPSWLVIGIWVFLGLFLAVVERSIGTRWTKR